MLTPVRFQGHLGARFGTKPRHLDVASPAEAIQALCATVPGFEAYVRASKTRFKVLVNSDHLPPGQLHDPSGRQEIRIVPVAKGAKSDGVEFLEGAALIAIGVVLDNPDVIYFGAQMDGIIAGVAIGIGVSMAIGGISRMLASTPNPPANTNSNLFTGAQNTIAQGVPVPVLYGEFYCTPPLISEAIDTESFAPGLFNSSYDGVGTWAGDGNTAAWGASLNAL